MGHLHFFDGNPCNGLNKELFCFLFNGGAVNQLASAKGEDTMKKLSIIDVKKMGKKLGVMLDKTAKKGEWIHAIQRAEGNDPCFAVRNPQICGQAACCWRPDCLEAAKH
jgi:hypothetical protein